MSNKNLLKKTFLFLKKSYIFDLLKRLCIKQKV